MNTYRIRYARRDPVYGPGWVVLYYKQITSTRFIRAKDKDAAVEKLTRYITKDWPESTIEICWWALLG